MSPDELVSFGRRCEYLTAVEEYWPKVLASLQDPTFRVYRECRTRNENSCALRTLGDLLTTLRDGTSPELQPVQEALQQWTQAHDIRDPWIWDAAVQSMDHWARGGTVGRWTYRPKELQTPRFQPRFGVWIPYFMKWVDFKTATDRIYRSDLTRYRAEVRKLWGEGKRSQHAVWTVLWQQGKSPEAIRNWHLRTTGKKVSLASIQLGVHAFAASAGLTLRK